MMPILIGFVLAGVIYLVAREYAEDKEKKDSAAQRKLPPVPSDLGYRSVGWPQMTLRTSGSMVMAQARTGNCCDDCKQGEPCSGCG